MICRLCRQNTVLCESHILSEFLYKPLYDSKHRLHVLSTAGADKKLPQKGVRELLLCEQCENRLSRFEGYARQVLFEPKFAKVVLDDAKGREYQVDYAKFKLFELSVLWRAGVSSLPEFRDAALGKHERRLRQMLLNESPGGTTDYGCFVSEPEKYPTVTDNVVVFVGVGKVRRLGNTQAARFIFARLSWVFFLTRKPLRPDLTALFLQDAGRWRILKGDFGVDKVIEDLAEKIWESKHRLGGR